MVSGSMVKRATVNLILLAVVRQQNEQFTLEKGDRQMSYKPMKKPGKKKPTMAKKPHDPERREEPYHGKKKPKK
jgi:hypothetical protein